MTMFIPNLETKVSAVHCTKKEQKHDHKRVTPKVKNEKKKGNNTVQSLRKEHIKKKEGNPKDAPKLKKANVKENV